MKPLISRSGAALAVGAALVASGAALPALADDQPRVYSALASGYAFDSTISNPSLPLGLVVEFAGPAAQASQDSLPSSDAFASFPYPGDTAAHLAQTGASLFGLPAPGYPLIAHTTINDEDPKRVSYPGVDLSAQSGDRLTQATAEGGSSASGGLADARVSEAGDGTVTAAADGSFDALRAGDILSIGASSSRAKLVVDSFGAVTKTWSLSLSNIQVPGAEYTIPTSTPDYIPIFDPIPGGPQPPPLTPPPVPLPFGGQKLKHPQFGFEDGYFTIQLPGMGTTQFAVPAQSVLDSLAAAGVKASYQRAVVTADTVTAPDITFAFSVPAPPSNPDYNGATDVNLTIGRSIAQVKAAGSSGSDGSSTPGSFTDGSTGSAPGVTSGGPGGSTSPALAASSGIPPLAGTVQDPVIAGPAAATPVGGTSSGHSPGSLVATGSLAGTADSWVYVLFVVLALAGFGAASTLRLVGVRARWMS